MEAVLGDRSAGVGVAAVLGDRSAGVGVEAVLGDRGAGVGVTAVLGDREGRIDGRTADRVDERDHLALGLARRTLRGGARRSGSRARARSDRILGVLGRVVGGGVGVLVGGCVVGGCIEVLVGGDVEVIAGGCLEGHAGGRFTVGVVGSRELFWSVESGPRVVGGAGCGGRGIGDRVARGEGSWSGEPCRRRGRPVLSDR